MSIVAGQTLYNWLLCLRIFAEMIWVGGGLAVITGRPSLSRPIAAHVTGNRLTPTAPAGSTR
jgi:hypothetical protein